MTFRIAQISDTHLSPRKPAFGANFAALAAHLRVAAPDLVINTGDLTVDGADHEADLVHARALHDAIGLPWKAIPGNHDVGENREFDDRQPFDAARRNRWLSIVGPDFWSQDVPGWRLVAVNSQLLGSGLPADAEQTAFVDDAVRGGDGRSILLMIHKPLCDVGLEDYPRNGRFVTLDPRQALLRALGERGAATIACGHVHQFRDHVVAGVRHVWAPSSAFVLPAWYQPTFGERAAGYVEHALNEDGSATATLVAPESMNLLDLADHPEVYGQLQRKRA